jgi:hypothetical protein
MRNPPNTALQRTRSAPLRSPLSFETFGAAKLQVAVFQVAIALVLGSTCNAQVATESEGGKAAVVGVWQFPGKLVWVKILADGRAFQCRIDPKGEVFRSEGALKGESQIEWQANWGTDTVTRDGKAIVLKGRKSIRLLPPTSEMRPTCKAPF